MYRLPLSTTTVLVILRSEAEPVLSEAEGKNLYSDICHLKPNDVDYSTTNHQRGDKGDIWHYSRFWQTGDLSCEERDPSLRSG